MSDGLDDELAALPKLGRAGLQDRWREVFRATPPKAFTPDLLARGIAHRLQEKSVGGLPPDKARLLQSDSQSRTRANLRPGNRLVRRWRGRTYVVEVTFDGLIYEGQRYSSLSVIASQITGARWSGPKFFGLVK